MPRDRRSPDWAGAFGNRLRDAIDRAGAARGAAVTQRSVAEQLGVTESAISKWIDGGVPAAWDRFKRLSELVGATPDELLGLAKKAPQRAAPPPDPDAPVRQEWIPLIANVAAGEPIADPREDAEDWYAFKAKWVHQVTRKSGTPVERLFAVKVGRGQVSMLPTIRPGASLVVDPGPEGMGVGRIEEGCIYVCKPGDGDGWTVKRAWMAEQSRYLVLKGDNPSQGAIVEDMKGRHLRDVVVGRVIYIGQEEA